MTLSIVKKVSLLWSLFGSIWRMWVNMYEYRHALYMHKENKRMQASLDRPEWGSILFCVREDLQEHLHFIEKKKVSPQMLPEQ